MEDQAESQRALDSTVLDFDLMDDVLLGNYTLDGGFSDLLRPSASSPLFEFASAAAAFQIIPENDNPVESHNENDIKMSSCRPEASNGSGTGTGTNWWIQPRSSLPSFKERLNHALRLIRESQMESDVLIQIWAPAKIGGKDMLTTVGQPFSLNPCCQRLADYRSVSTKFHFAAERSSYGLMGMPGRVFVGRVPEWTPDARYFSSYEYPRVVHAQHFDVRGTIALPIFERDGPACLGVVEVVRTTQKINYSTDLDAISNAFQAVDLRSSGTLSISPVQMRSDLYLSALPEIWEVLRAVCETHNLPLAQTWMSCTQQGRRNNRHSDENYKDCISTVDCSCYVKDHSMLGFHEACSEHHLFKGQGVAGKAFTINGPCFSSDITSFSKIEYPLSHHARLFNLRAAVAVCLRSINTGNTNFVLEFFLPISCVAIDEQKLILNALSSTMQHVCQSLRVVTDKELEAEAKLQADVLNSSDALLVRPFPTVGDSAASMRPSKVGSSVEPSSWISNTIMEGEKIMFPSHGSVELSKPEIQKFTVSCFNHRDVLSSSGEVLPDAKVHPSASFVETSDRRTSFTDEPCFPTAGKGTNKRRTKTEKTISLQVLRRYFSGSLKDAAKSLGVCSTTLKRICRQHGITRWPSRKLKKVEHSLKKIQLAIDSVHGAERSIQFSSLYENFTNTPSPCNLLSVLTSKEEEPPNASKILQQGELRTEPLTSASNSLSSSSSQTSSSSQCCSSGTKQYPQEGSSIPNPEVQPLIRRGSLSRVHNQVELCLKDPDASMSITRSQSHEIVVEHQISSSQSFPQKNKISVLKVKAMYGEERVRFRLQPTWTFHDLKQEITKRFYIENMDLVNLKYMDDDLEWVLMTCDADLQECIDVHESSSFGTIKISVYPVCSRSNTTLGHS